MNAAALPAPAPGGDDPRPEVDSFDVFDTLIARRCIEPHRVFEAIAPATGLADFAARRQAAEAAVAHGPYTLADIYARLAADLALPAGAAERLMALEVEAELAAVIPIAENLARVKDGDLLISDMYLGEAVIRRLLVQAGLTREVGLFVSAHGKRSGEVWPLVKAQFALGRHLGDNEHSDVAMPTRFGITAEKTDRFAPSAVEAWFLNLGLRDMAELLREARLSSWRADPVRRQLQLTQIQLNLPILILSSIELARVAKAAGASHLLFASRDGRQWAGLHRAVAAQAGGEPPPVEYFYTSRRARTAGSPDYLDYARERLGERGLVVDTCGSGWSMAMLFQALGLEGRDLFFVHRIATPEIYRRRADPPAGARIHALVGPEAPGVNNMVLELANTAEHGSVRDVRRLAGKPLPLFEADPRPEPVRRRVAEQAEDFAAAAALVTPGRLRESLSLSSPDIAAVVHKLYQVLCLDQTLIATFAAAHLDEDRAAMAAMGMV